ncbi:hypothetical protein E2562_021011 [Oryza meyeriana var. granulata]|uniref:Uncharacterized protein n=1 Tax=Oryza meyeriana var. granulata TaxID=110450 RepID=A0A6G1FAR8_9ORYZ|nr:hypothetical protein E2562_021011 [Oryza meyeriana var. granulata]
MEDLAEFEWIPSAHMHAATRTNPDRPIRGVVARKTSEGVVCLTDQLWVVVALGATPPAQQQQPPCACAGHRGDLIALARAARVPLLLSPPGLEKVGSYGIFVEGISLAVLDGWGRKKRWDFYLSSWLAGGCVAAGH